MLASKQNIRVLIIGPLSKQNAAELEYRSVVGGLLVQSRDTALAQPETFKIVTKLKPTPTQYADLWFAWRVCKYVKSNAIVFAREGMTIGVGAGQMSRVYSTRVAALKAKDEGLDRRRQLHGFRCVLSVPRRHRRRRRIWHQGHRAARRQQTRR